MFADIPATPTQAPTSNPAKTSASNLSIQVETETDDGLSPILSYNVQIDDGHGREFTELYGGSVDSLSTAFDYGQAVKGLVYRVRYRVKNAVGWSDYSPIGYLRAADKP